MDKSATVDKGVSMPISAPSLVEKSVIETQVKSESLLNQLSSNKLYIYIIIAIVVLAIIGYYLYNKHFSKKDKSEKPETNSTKKDIESKKHILSPDTEYYLLDRSGNPILMNQHFANFLHPSQEQSVLVNNKLVQHQEPLKQKNQQRPKLSHPNEESNVEVNITDNEDDNIATQDLTREEIEELKKQLDLMQRKQSAPITAQNDEDGDEANF
jgi:hypothetical protein